MKGFPACRNFLTELLARSADVRMGPGRECFSDVDTVSIDERCSNGSFSFAARRINSSSASTARLHAPAAIVFGNRHAERMSAGPPTETSEYFDATDSPGPLSSLGSSHQIFSQARSHSARGSPKHQSTSPQELGECMRFEGNNGPWGAGPEQKGEFVSPAGNPRHPGLKKNSSAPSTHQLMHGGEPRSPKWARGTRTVAVLQ